MAHTVLWELPESVIFLILSYTEASTHRAQVICHQLAPLCKAAKKSLLEDEENCAVLWETLLTVDYGGNDRSHTSDRQCKRLKRGPIHKVAHAHLRIKDNTEIAYFYVSELTSASKGKLSKGKFSGILNEFGPHLRVNSTMSSGGIFLVEVCRSRNVRETVILKCVKDLVEERGALVDQLTSESPGSRMNALCVAAARGMPSVVRYLLDRGARRDIKSSGRFRLHTEPKKTIRCTNLTPVEFSKSMRDAEKAAGASERALADLDECIALLE